MNKQETICVNALLAHFNSETSAVWSISIDDLDARHNDRPTPECIITDGKETAGVEVKALKGPQDHNDFFGGLEYLGRMLAPTTRGHFTIVPPYDNSPRWNQDFIRLLKEEVEKVAPTLTPGGSMGYLNIPRRCRVVGRPSAGASVSCQHGSPEPLRAASGQISGAFMLIDQDACVSLDSDAGKQTFIDAVVSTCNRVANGEPDVWIDWLDEWPILRAPQEESSVEVIASGGAFSVPAAVNGTIWKAVKDGKRKFNEQWGDRHILLLDSQFHFTDVDRVRAVLEEVPPQDFSTVYGEVDEVVLYWHRKIWPVFRKPTTMATTIE